MNIPKVIDLVVKNDLCIGCGLCVYKCPSKALKMNWNEYGFLTPELVGKCDSDTSCLSVCPFNPFPEKEVKTENEIANLFLADNDFANSNIGRYNGIYVGYSVEHRAASSSGGIATYILAELLERGIVQNIFSVKTSDKSAPHYEYVISRSKEEILSASKTRYYPVTLAEVFSKINELEGTVAIVGVACFIKAIRLAQYKNPMLKAKIPFLIGIICGGFKSTFFTDYLAGKAGVNDNGFKNPEYRVKDYNSSAGDYSFSCVDNKYDETKKIKMRAVGDMWGTGLFKANACDFCDDVTTELADISLGDAWIEPFVQDGRGTNVIVTRSTLVKEILTKGSQLKKVVLEELPLNKFLSSQQGSFNHRQKGLSHRINIAKRAGFLIPPKRFNQKTSLDFMKVQSCRVRVRKRSLEIWKENKNSNLFDKEIEKEKQRLRFYTRIYHYRKAIFSKVILSKIIRRLSFIVKG